jgi:hypothetical protein
MAAVPDLVKGACILCSTGISCGVCTAWRTNRRQFDKSGSAWSGNGRPASCAEGVSKALCIDMPPGSQCTCWWQPCTYTALPHVAQRPPPAQDRVLFAMLARLRIRHKQGCTCLTQRPGRAAAAGSGCFRLEKSACVEAITVCLLIESLVATFWYALAEAGEVCASGNK